MMTSIDAQHKLKRTHLEIHFDAMCKQQPTTSRRSFHRNPKITKNLQQIVFEHQHH
jgi:hypothetical protein